MLDKISHPGGLKCLPYHITQLAVTLTIFFRALEKTQNIRAENAVSEMLACLNHNKGRDSRHCAVYHRQQNCSLVHKCLKQKVHTVL